MRLLFVKSGLAWPRASGHDVHTFFMMRACSELGHEIGLATVQPPAPEALAGLVLSRQFSLPGPGTAPVPAVPGSWLQRRFRSFWGISDARIVALQNAVTEWRPEAVVLVGLDALPYAPGLHGVQRIWYAADEWVLHHLSQLDSSPHSWREHVPAAILKGLYERAHRSAIERAWVVSDADRFAMRWYAGIRAVDVLPNGVDSDFYSPGPDVPDATAVFWGRLDFGPNVQALTWFCERVWPLVLQRCPGARFTIIGFNPSDRVRAFAQLTGVTMLPNLADLRAEVQRHAVAVFPFVSGAGIKNKLLEGAAMGLPSVCTPTAVRGLKGAPLPFSLGSTPQQFSDAILQLWGDANQRRRQAHAVREWVVTHHSWATTAQEAMRSVGTGHACQATR